MPDITGRESTPARGHRSKRTGVERVTEAGRVGSKLMDRIATLAHYSGPIRETDADRFLRLAEECLKEAEKAINPLDKDAWLKLAEEWLQLARAAKERGADQLQWTAGSLGLLQCPPDSLQQATLRPKRKAPLRRARGQPHAAQTLRQLPLRVSQSSRSWRGCSRRGL
jgi:hypothetical protein